MVERRGGDGEKAVLVNDIQTYKRELLAKDQTINDLKQSIALLDQNLDEMQSELDMKTEELSQARIQFEKQCLEFGNVQHMMSVTAGKEDNYQRKLFERENEIRMFKNEVQSLREQVDTQTQLAQLKTQEVAELTEDIQTLTRENRFVNQEFGKSSHANELLKNQNNELIDRERRAQQHARALELEKEDILQNYREACM
jgi:chromosome segregation ATPase